MNRLILTMAAVSLSTGLTFAQTTDSIANEALKKHCGYVLHKSGWTLQECIDYALANNISLKKKSISGLTAQESLKQSKAALLPSLSASTVQSGGFRPWPNQSQGTVSNGTVQMSVDKFSYNGTYGLNANWTVWNGNKNRNTIKQDELAVEQANADSLVTAKSIQEQITQLYIQILYTTEALKVNQYSYETSLANEERGKQMVEVGKMSKADLAQLTAQTASDQYNIAETQSNLNRYKLQLKQLLEITDENEFNVAIPEASDSQALASIPSSSTVYEAALNKRPEIIYSQLGIKSNDIAIKIAKAGKLPTVSLTGGAVTSTSSMSQNTWGNQMKTNFDITAGVSVSVPIFDNRQTKTAVNKAKLQKENAILELQEKQKDLWNTIEGYWIDANNNQQKFIAAKYSVDSAQQSYDLMSEQFKLGLKNIIELMNSKTNLLKAQQDMLQSKYMTILSLQMLEFYKGE